MKVYLKKGGEVLPLEVEDGATVEQVAGDGVVVTTSTGEQVSLNEPVEAEETYQAVPRSPKGGR